MFVTFVVPPATLLPPPGLEMNTRDAGFTLSRSVAKPKLLKFDARSLYFERASYFAKLNPGWNKIFCSHFGKLCQTVFKSSSCQFLARWFMGKGLVLYGLFV